MVFPRERLGLHGTKYLLKKYGNSILANSYSYKVKYPQKTGITSLPYISAASKFNNF